MDQTPPKYAIQVACHGRYDWTAILADCTTQPPKATTVMAKSIHELMAKVLVTVTLREDSEAQAARKNNDHAETNPALLKPPGPRIILP